MVETTYRILPASNRILVKNCNPKLSKVYFNGFEFQKNSFTNRNNFSVGPYNRAAVISPANLHGLAGHLFPTTTRHWPDVVLMLARRLRRRPNIKTTLGQRLVFAGWLYSSGIASVS